MLGLIGTILGFSLTPPAAAEPLVRMTGNGAPVSKPGDNQLFIAATPGQTAPRRIALTAVTTTSRPSIEMMGMGKTPVDAGCQFRSLDKLPDGVFVTCWLHRDLDWRSRPRFGTRLDRRAGCLCPGTTLGSHGGSVVRLRGANRTALALLRVDRFAIERSAPYQSSW